LISFANQTYRKSEKETQKTRREREKDTYEFRELFKGGNLAALKFTR